MKTGLANIPDITRFKKLLKDKNLRATPQRLAVHECMMKLGHASADMVAEHVVANSNTDITVASVYNILMSLAEKGIYSRRFSSNNKMYFDANPSRHIHLYDTKNNEYKDIADEELMPMVEAHFKGRRFRGYRIDRIDIQIVCHATERKKKQ